MWNLVRYNVIGGGQSALYGTEGPLYYARNLFNAFNLALVLVPVAPLVRLSWSSLRLAGTNVNLAGRGVRGLCER